MTPLLTMGVELVSRPYFSYNFLIKNMNWLNFITKLCLLPRLLKLCFVFHAWAFDDIVTFQYPKI